VQESVGQNAAPQVLAKLLFDVSRNAATIVVSFTRLAEKLFEIVFDDGVEVRFLRASWRVPPGPLLVGMANDLRSLGGCPSIFWPLVVVGHGLW
jgi:hypothetical protein